MKRLIVILSLIAVLAGPVFGQQTDFTDFLSTFKTFGSSIGPAVPLASSIGLNWSDAYIGQLLSVPPKFGVGVTVGAVFLPAKEFEAVATEFGANLDNIPLKDSLGVPFPVYTIEGRIGGFLLDFDMGVKLGYIPKEMKGDKKFDVDYLMAGADIRFPLIKPSLVKPGLSIGGGYTFLRGGVGLPVGNFALENIDGINNVTFTEGRVGYNWQAHVLDAKIHLSKSLLLITPYAGLGASYGITRAGGGLTGTVDYGDLTEEEVKAAMGDADFVDVSSEGILALYEANSVNTRVYGGVAFNLLILKLDVQGMYEITSGTLGASLNGRIQL